MTNIPNIDFNKVTDKDNTLFNQTQYYEGNFDKINQQVVPKINELDNSMGAAEGRLDLAEADLDDHEGRIGDVELGKVDKVAGKQLSTEDFTTEEKTKLNVDIPAQLAEKVQNFKIKNEVVNGDFSQGTTGWGTSAGASLGPITANELEVILSLVEPSAVGAFYGLVNTNIKYIAVNYYSYGNIERLVLGGTAKEVNLSMGWHKHSVVTTNSGPQRFYARDNIALKYKIRKPLIIDLTKTFGSGNEPTKLEMDELMKVIPDNWWNGELSLTQKQYVTWQLNLIRKNTNAIIALGGTII